MHISEYQTYTPQTDLFSEARVYHLHIGQKDTLRFPAETLPTFIKSAMAMINARESIPHDSFISEKRIQDSIVGVRVDEKEYLLLLDKSEFAELEEIHDARRQGKEEG